MPLDPEHKLYTEAFVGGGALLFAKEPPKVEVINDLNDDLITFYRVAQATPQALISMVQGTLHSHSTHKQAREILLHSDAHTALERAWTVWVCSAQSYASKLDGTFGYDRSGSTTRKVSNKVSVFTEELLARLRNLTIESEDALKCIARYDCPVAFHFVDPPYVGGNCGHYANMFSDEDFQNLLKLLSGLSGKFMLTMFPNETLSEFTEANNWHVTEVTRTISAASASHRRKQVELIVTNYEV